MLLAGLIGIALDGVGRVSPILAFDGVVGERLGDEVGDRIAFSNPAGDVESAAPGVLVVARCVGEVRRPHVEPRAQADDDGVRITKLSGASTLRGATGTYGIRHQVKSEDCLKRLDPSAGGFEATYPLQCSAVYW